MSIKTKILLPLLSFLFLTVLISAFLGQQSVANHTSLAALSSKAVAAADASRSARDAFDRGDRFVAQVLAMTDFTTLDTTRSRFESESNTASSSLDALKAASLSPEMTTLTQDAIDCFEKWRGNAEVLLGLRPAAEIAAPEVLNRQADKIRTVLNQAVALAGQDSLRQISKAGADMWRRLTMVCIIVGLVVVGGIVVALRLAVSLSRPLVLLVRSAETLAAGDVHVEIPAQNRADEIGLMARSVQVFKDNSLKLLAASARAEAEEQRAATATAQAEEQRRRQAVFASIAAGLQETAAALNVTTDTVRTMAGNTTDAAAVVATTRRAAESSGAVVQLAVDAMGKIKGSSSQIAKIIGIIDEIAMQTNLLALNASVEAARAGMAGRGFAVVAAEVGNLAQRSADSAKQIKDLISASASQVDSGVVLVNQTGTALKDIVAKIAEMDQLVRQISAASQEQAAGLAEINTAVGQMDRLVQQNAALAEGGTAPAQKSTALRGAKVVARHASAVETRARRVA